MVFFPKCENQTFEFADRNLNNYERLRVHVQAVAVLSYHYRTVKRSKLVMLTLAETLALYWHQLLCALGVRRLHADDDGASDNMPTVCTAHSPVNLLIIN